MFHSGRPVSNRRFKEVDNLVTNFVRPDASAQVRRSQLHAAGIFCIQSLSHGYLDELRLLLETERVTTGQLSGVTAVTSDYHASDRDGSTWSCTSRSEPCGHPC